MNATQRITIGMTLGLAVVGGILGTRDALYPSQEGADAGTQICRQCECSVEDDAGVHRSGVLSFAADPGDSLDDLMQRACGAEARRVCGLGSIANEDFTAEQRRCFRSLRDPCMSAPVVSAACRRCTAPKPCEQTEPVVRLARNASDFNCACRSPAPDAGVCRIPNPDGGAGFVPAPLGVVMQPGQWSGAGCIRGIPCEEYTEIRATEGIGYALPEACR
jgi:hypothetical protein